MTRFRMKKNENLKCAETPKNDVFGAAGTDFFGDLKII